MIRNRLTLGTLRVPIATVSRAVRKVSLQLLPMTGSTPTPVANVMELDRPPSTKVELFDESNLTWLAHAVPHWVPAQRCEMWSAIAEEGGHTSKF